MCSWICFFCQKDGEVLTIQIWHSIRLIICLIKYNANRKDLSSSKFTVLVTFKGNNFFRSGRKCPRRAAGSHLVRSEKRGFCCLKHGYVSVNSKPEHPLGNFLKGDPPPLGIKKVQNPDPWSRKIVLKAHPYSLEQLFSKIQQKAENMRQKLYK